VKARPNEPAVLGGGGNRVMMKGDDDANADLQVLVAKAHTREELTVFFKKANNNADVKLIYDALEEMGGLELFRDLGKDAGGTAAPDSGHFYLGLTRDFKRP
jgi:hypothetical protein